MSSDEEAVIEPQNVDDASSLPGSSKPGRKEKNVVSTPEGIRSYARTRMKKYKEHQERSEKVFEL